MPREMLIRLAILTYGVRPAFKELLQSMTNIVV